MDCIREAEKYLWHYRDLVKCMDNAGKQIGLIIKASVPKGVGVSNLAGEIYRKGNAGTLNDLYQMARWRQIWDETELKIKELEELFEGLKEEFVVNGSVIVVSEEGEEKEHPLTYREFLFMWYVQQMNKSLIAKKLNYSERSLYRLRDQAIQKFAIQLFGLTALEAV